MHGTVSSAHFKEMFMYSDRKYSSLFNTDSKGTVSSVRIIEMSMFS